MFVGDFFPKYFEQELRDGLTRARYRFPEDLQVEFRTSPRMPAERETWIQVETEARVLAKAAWKHRWRADGEAGEGSGGRPGGFR